MALVCLWQSGVESSPGAITTVRSESRKAALPGEYLIEPSCFSCGVPTIPRWALTLPEASLQSWSGTSSTSLPREASSSHRCLPETSRDGTVCNADRAVKRQRHGIAAEGNSQSNTHGNVNTDININWDSGREDYLREKKNQERVFIASTASAVPKQQHPDTHYSGLQSRQLILPWRSHTVRDSYLICRMKKIRLREMGGRGGRNFPLLHKENRLVSRFYEIKWSVHSTRTIPTCGNGRCWAGLSIKGNLDTTNARGLSS